MNVKSSGKRSFFAAYASQNPGQSESNCQFLSLVKIKLSVQTFSQKIRIVIKKIIPEDNQSVAPFDYCIAPFSLEFSAYCIRQLRQRGVDTLKILVSYKKFFRADLADSLNAFYIVRTVAGYRKIVSHRLGLKSKFLHERITVVNFRA